MGAWIEIKSISIALSPIDVAPYMGAWIEIVFCIYIKIVAGGVAPYMGAWIEISALSSLSASAAVAPYMGAWIEISMLSFSKLSQCLSHPTWVRGLKFLSCQSLFV